MRKDLVSLAVSRWTMPTILSPRLMLRLIRLEMMKPFTPCASTLLVSVMITFAVMQGVYAGTFTISSHANIFGAGHSPPADTPGSSGAGGGVPPVAFTFPAQQNQVVTFSNVTGSVDFGNPTEPNGPDGGNFAYQVASFNGIAGINAPVLGFLAGVFLDPAEPADPAPPPLDFSVIGTNFGTLSPQLRQVFFIGDGLTETGEIQSFNVPPTATRLFLGIADAHYFGSEPGAYDDNTGWFTVTVNLATTPPEVQRLAATPQTNATTAVARPAYAASSQPIPIPKDSTFGYALPDGIGLTHWIEASGDLLNWMPATNVVLYFKDMDSINFSQRFYRFSEKSNSRP